MDRPLRKQTTLAHQTAVTGFGFWSSQDVRVEFRPAPANSGIVFVRTDLPGQPRIPAVVQNRINGPRRTTLVANGAAVEMVEHVLAALAGLQIDNCEIHVDGAEMPGCDGSSIDFVNALVDIPVITLAAERPRIEVLQTIRVGDEFSWIQAEPVAHGQLELAYQLDYPCPAIGSQVFSTTVDPIRFACQIAPARTFVLQQEAEQLRQQGLGIRATFQDVLVFDDDGPISNPLRFDDECARHKVLDMVGDFSLSGSELVGKFTAFRSGHRLNSQMVFAVLQQVVSNQPQTRRVPA